jgi:hypothetical protein
MMPRNGHYQHGVYHMTPRLRKSASIHKHAEGAEAQAKWFEELLSQKSYSSRN